MPSATLHQLAALVGGTIVGPGDTEPGDLEIVDALPLQDAYEGCLTLADHPKHGARVTTSRASAVIVPQPLSPCKKPQLVVERVHDAFQIIIAFLRCEPELEPICGVHASVVIDPTAQLGRGTTVQAGTTIAQDCVIGSGCVIHCGVHIMAGCRVGNDCQIFPGVSLYPQTRLGDRVLIHAGAVIGAYGFGYRKVQGRHVRTAQLGRVEIGDDVEIGAATTIDRGTYGPTKIGEGTKIDNQVQVGHNCQIGKHNLICAQVGIAGSTTTGDHVVLAGQVGISDHVHLADGVVVGAQSGVINNVKQDAVVLGSPAAPHRQRMVEWALIARLPEMRNELKALREKVDELESRSAAENPNAAAYAGPDPTLRIA